MPEQISVETTQNVDLQFEVASLGDRILAYLIDGLIKGALIFVLILVFSIIAPGLFSSPQMPVIFYIVLSLLIVIPFAFYHLLFEIFNHGQSPGKRVFQLRVVSINGAPVSIGAYLLRWVFRIVDFHIFSGLVAVIAVASGKKGQRVGDMVAGTTVIKEVQRVTLSQLAYQKVQPDYVPVYPQAVQLNAQHIELIRETLNNLALNNVDAHVRLLADKTAGMLNITYSEHPRKFLRTIVQDYSRVLT
jgi:uncharacterized RDD family membrane protein YckC